LLGLLIVHHPLELGHQTDVTANHKTLDTITRWQFDDAGGHQSLLGFLHER
jgi:hypothetical protein